MTKKKTKKTKSPLRLPEKQHILTIKRVTTISEDYVVIPVKSLGYHNLPEKLMNEKLHLEQSLMKDEVVRVRDEDGVVVAILEKEGASGPDQVVSITEMNNPHRD